MADNNPFFRTGAGSIDRVNYDAGLRAHMQSVFNYMGGGLAVTGLVAFIVAYVPALTQLIFGTPVKWLVIFAPLVFLMYMNFKIQSISAARLQGLFWAFCTVMGLSTAAIFLVFTQASIARAFFITAATFGAMSLYGYTTKRDLTSMGAFLMMGVLGLFLASIANLFMASPALQWVVSVVGVVVFTGLTAFHVQDIKQNYDESWGREANNKLAVYGALQLYINFINAFRFLLELMGARRS